jgi:hypothetical protein
VLLLPDCDAHDNACPTSSTQRLRIKHRRGASAVAFVAAARLRLGSFREGGRADEGDGLENGLGSSATEMAVTSFAERFRVVVRHPDTSSPWLDPRLLDAHGYEAFATEAAGRTFDDGLYRVHDDRSGPEAEKFISLAFPDFAGRVCPLSFDWLGRQFALDAKRSEGGEALILMLEPGTGQALEIPLSFSSFHEQLHELREPALADSFFRRWVGTRPDSVPLLPQTCVGYQVPLFLGGRDEIDNLELIDIDVYWSICGQLRLGTRKLPEGTTIKQVSYGS